MIAVAPQGSRAGFRMDAAAGLPRMHMAEDTWIMGEAERKQSLDRSLPRRPRTATPGYECLQLLGRGAFGEVWRALDKNTNVAVAIKFYTHPGGLDWSLLSREVDKLRMLSND